MTSKIRNIVGITSLLIVLAVGFIVYGIYLMADEDKYGDLVYISEKVQDGDLILKSNNEFQKGVKWIFKNLE